MALNGKSLVKVFCFPLKEGEWYRGETFGINMMPERYGRDYFSFGGTTIQVFEAKRFFEAMKAYVWFASSWKNYSDLANWLNEVNE